MKDRLRFFPGMPLLTQSVIARLAANCPGHELVLVFDTFEEPIGREESYTVYVGDHVVGSFAVRRSGLLVERNFFCKLPAQTSLPSGAIVEGSFGTGSNVMNPPARQLPN